MELGVEGRRYDGKAEGEVEYLVGLWGVGWGEAVLEESTDEHAQLPNSKH